jgi:hypothetical protein
MRNHHARYLEDRMTCKANYVSMCKANYAVIMRDILLEPMMICYIYSLLFSHDRKMILTGVIKCI